MNIEKKLFEEYVTISSSHFKGEEPFLCGIIGDIHFHEHVNTKIFDNLLDYYLKKNINCFILPGDIICDSKFLSNYLKDYITIFLKELGRKAPVLITFGNHELREKKEEINTFFESLEKYQNIILLNNKQIIFNGISFSGFCPSYEIYLRYNNQKNYDRIIDEYIKSEIKIKKDDFNIFITHSPLTLNSLYIKEAIKEFFNIDVLISGHMHNGYIPKRFSKLNENTKGGLILTPPFHFNIERENCRGVSQYGRGEIIITKGFRKYISNSMIINYLENYTSNDITTLELKKD